MALKYDIVATTGTYTKDGETKYKNKNVGAVISTTNGPRIKLDASFNPAGCPRDDDGQIWLALFEPRRDNPPQGAPQQPHSNASGGTPQQHGPQAQPAGDPGFDDDLDPDIPL